MKAIVPIEAIERKIYWIRGRKVMLSPDLAELYGVEPKVLMQAVKRNIERFPDDFIFQLEYQEVVNLKSQFVTSSWGGARRSLPYAFTEQGIAMLSGILNSDRAIEVNVQIMRTFVKLRAMIVSHKNLAKRLDELEKKYDLQFKIVLACGRRRGGSWKEERGMRCRGTDALICGH